MSMPLRHRFVVAYAVLALAVAGSGFATWQVVGMQRPKPLAPGAVLLVKQFLGALQQGDLLTVCRMFSGFPSCSPGVGLGELKSYRVMAAEPAVDGVIVPATLNGQDALFSVKPRAGGYRIDDILADPAGPVQAQLGV
jgi:hypothetical protein